MKLTGGEALIKQLELEGVTQIFGIPGVQLDYAVDALRRSKQIDFKTTRNEQSTSYMADGYARTTGKPGVCMVVPGPGVLNALAGLSTAFACNSRVLCVAGHIHSGAIGKGHGLLHEIKDQSGVFDSVTKWHGCAMSVAEIPGLIRRAFVEMNSGRPGPVAVEVPQDVLMATGEVELIAPPAGMDYRLKPDASVVRKAAELLDGAAFPVIYAGGGVMAAHGGAALAKLAERMGIPVVVSENARGVISDRHPLCFSTLEGRVLMQQADVVAVVGTRFAETRGPEASWKLDGQTYIYVNADPEACGGAPRAPGLNVLADAGLALEALHEEIEARQGKRRALDQAKVSKLRALAKAELEGVQPQAGFVKAIRAALPDNGVFINELTQTGYFARVAFPTYAPYTHISPGHQGTLGYGFPTGLGVAAGNPGRPVVCITGDGGFGWCMQELSTAKKYNLGLVTVVFADGHFANVKNMAMEQFGEAYQTALGNPDFVAFANSFGVPAVRVSDAGGLETAIKDALAKGGPALIEVAVGEMGNPWTVLRLKGKVSPEAPNFR